MKLSKLRNAMDCKTFVFYDPVGLGLTLDSCVKEMQSIKERCGFEVAMEFNGVLITTLDIEEVGPENIDRLYKKRCGGKSASLEEAIKEARRQWTLSRWYLLFLEMAKIKSDFMIHFSDKNGLSHTLFFINHASIVGSKNTSGDLFHLKRTWENSDENFPKELIDYLDQGGYLTSFITEDKFFEIIAHLIDSGYTIK